MKHSVKHGLGKETACKVAKAAFDTYEKKFADYQPVTKWTGDDHADVSFSAKGMNISATISVDEQNIDIDMNVPFLLKPLKGKAVALIEESINEWIVKAKNGELG
ncbi:MAG: polyhydroxyalkanoic acid system family protein [Polyangiaceae bacterium]|nr:polyhydroxyalkanoic acid system family protein [Polyangiaceae bacterium]